MSPGRPEARFRQLLADKFCAAECDRRGLVPPSHRLKLKFETAGPRMPASKMRGQIQGCTKRWTPGSVNMERKIAFPCLLQAGERNFSSSYSRNLASTF